MIKRLFTLVSVILLTTATCFCDTGNDYKEKTLVEGLENLCNFATGLNAAQLRILDSEDGNVYLEISANDEHYEYFNIKVKDGKLVIKEKNKKGQQADGRHALMLTEHPFVETEYFKKSGIRAQSYRVTARKIQINGCLVFDDGTYWEPSFVKIYRPLKCKDLQ